MEGQRWNIGFQLLLQRNTLNGKSKEISFLIFNGIPTKECAVEKASHHISIFDKLKLRSIVLVSNCSYSSLGEGELVINCLVIFINYINRRPEVEYRFPIGPNKEIQGCREGKSWESPKRFLY
jgi:hypothetical protein